MCVSLLNRLRSALDSRRVASVLLVVVASGCGAIFGVDFDRPAALGALADGAVDASSDSDTGVDASCTSAPCVTATCDGGTCTTSASCDGVRCDDVPAAICFDAMTRRSYDAQCVSGACSYPSTDTHCASGCQASLCIGDPCAGVTCEKAPVCDDDHTLRTFAGTCSGGSCSYAPTTTICANGCKNGKCGTRVCQNLSNTPTSCDQVCQGLGRGCNPTCLHDQNLGELAGEMFSGNDCTGNVIGWFPTCSNAAKRGDYGGVTITCCCQ
jgi:hypothetical protein